jgi:hypothetical protein
MLENNSVLIDFQEGMKTFYYYSEYDDSDFGGFSYLRPSSDKKYELQYISDLPPFNGEALSVNEFARIMGYTLQQAKDSIESNEYISDYNNIFLGKVNYVPDLDLDFCHSEKSTMLKYAWSYDEESKAAAIWIKRLVNVYAECSDSEKTINISTYLKLWVINNQDYNAFFKSLNTNADFIENKQTQDGISQVFKYVNKSDGKSYIIICIKNLQETGGTIKVFWDSNPKSNFTLYKQFSN